MNESHWAQRRERGSLFWMRLSLRLTRLLGRRLMAPVLYGVVLYFFVTGRSARASIREYYTNLAAFSGQPRNSMGSGQLFRHFMAFADSILDKFDVLHGKLTPAKLDIDDPHEVLVSAHERSGRGQILVGAHLGNLEVCRALAEAGRRVRMNVLVHTAHAEKINRLLDEQGASNLNLIQVSQLDAAAMLRLSEGIERGEWLAIAGDRIPLNDRRRSRVSFLGQPAWFAQGPWLLAGLLECPVNLFFCLKLDGRYRICVEPFAERIQWQRSNRKQVLQEAAQRYASRLEQRCLQAPQQWFNFYPFWNTDEQQTS